MKVEGKYVRIAFLLDTLVPTRPCLIVFTGTITIVREGCVPAVKVQQVFERVKNCMM